MYRCRLPFLLLSLFTCVGSQGQPPGDSSIFTRNTRTEGLSNNYITGIVQDSLGYIWGDQADDGSARRRIANLLIHQHDQNHYRR
jgi:ligand-binding sensor domain-containing protein